MTSLTIFCDDMLFKNIQKYSNAKRLLVSLNNKSVEYPDVIDFINHIAYNRQKFFASMDKIFIFWVRLALG